MNGKKRSKAVYISEYESNGVAWIRLQYIFLDKWKERLYEKNKI